MSTPSQTVLAGLGQSLWRAEEHIRALAERIASLEAKLAVALGAAQANADAASCAVLRIASLEAERDRAYTSFQFKLNNKREECEGLREHVAYLKDKLVECNAELEAIKAARAASTSAKGTAK